MKLKLLPSLRLIIIAYFLAVIASIQQAHDNYGLLQMRPAKALSA